MKPSKKGYAAVESKQPFSGIAVRDPSTMIPPDFSPDSLNMTFLKGNLKKRGGYTQLGPQLMNGMSPSTDPVMALISFTNLADAYFLVAITTTREYYYDVGGNSLGDITLQSSGSDSLRTGTVDDPVDWCVGVDENGKWLYITNGIDPPRKWDGNAANFALYGGNLTDFKTCQTLAVFAGSLFFGNITFNSTTDEPQSYAWSDTGNFLEWNLNNAGAQLLSDITGPILKMLPFQNQLSVYSADSITLVSFVGGTELFSPQTILTNVRLLGTNSIVDVGPYQFVANTENVYVFDGTQLMRPFGDLIQNDYRADLYLENGNQANIFFDGVNTQFLLIVPTTGENVVYSAEFNFNNFWWDRAGTDPYKQGSGRWSKFEFADPPVCFGQFVSQSNLLWNSALISTITWAGMSDTWNVTSSKAEYPDRVFGGLGKVFLFNDTITSDNGVPIEGYFETMDYTVPQLYESIYARFLEVEMEIAGSGEVEISYSTDLGSTWMDVEGSDSGGFSGGFQTVSTYFTRYKFFLDTFSTTFRVRVQSVTATGTFQLRWIRVWFKPETEINVG